GKNVAEAELGMCHPEDKAAAFLDPAHRDRADSLLERELERATRDQSLVRKHPGGADGGMARELQLAGGREDADLRGVRRIFRRQDEGRLRKVHLARDALHVVGRNLTTVEHDRQLVSSKRLLRENVNDKKNPPH